MRSSLGLGARPVQFEGGADDVAAEAVEQSARRQVVAARERLASSDGDGASHRGCSERPVIGRRGHRSLTLDGVVEPISDAFLQRYATEDVRATIAWLEDQAYQLTDHQIAADGSSNMVLAYTGATTVRIVYDRTQWSMAIGPGIGAKPIPFDLLVAASHGVDYEICFPNACTPAALPDQLPGGVSWPNTLPVILDWIPGAGVTEAVARAQDQRYAMMWPNSHKARQLRRLWRTQTQ
jgi:hypothetical protein